MLEVSASATTPSVTEPTEATKPVPALVHVQETSTTAVAHASTPSPAPAPALQESTKIAIPAFSEIPVNPDMNKTGKESGNQEKKGGGGGEKEGTTENVANPIPLRRSSRKAEVYCICNGIDDGSFMLACDLCDEWFHGACVGISISAASKLANFICLPCQKKDENYHPKEEERKGKKRPRSHSVSTSIPSPKKKKKEEKKETTAAAPPPPPQPPVASPVATEDSRISRQRISIAGALKKAFTQDETTSEEKAAAISEKIVNSVFSIMGTLLSNKESRDAKFSSLLTNLKDPENTKLRSKIINGSMNMATLCSLSDIELTSNSEELMALHKKMNEEALRQVIRSSTDTTVYRKTHKGEQIVQEADCGAGTYEYNDISIQSAEARRAMMETENNDDIFSLEKEIKPQEEAQECVEEKKQKDFEEATILQDSDSERKERHEESQKKIEAQKEQLQYKKEQVGMGKLLEDSHRVLTIPDSSLIKNKLTLPSKVLPVSSKTITWQGFIEKSPDLPSFGTKAVHVCGKHIGKVFGMNDLTVIGRMDAKKMKEYFSKLNLSNSVKRAALYLLPQSHEHELHYNAMFQHFYSKSKVAVVEVAPFSDIIRELFIVPFPGHASLPDFIMKKPSAATLVNDGVDKLLCFAVYYRSSGAAFSSPVRSPVHSPADDTFSSMPLLPEEKKKEVVVSTESSTRTLQEMATPSLSVAPSPIQNLPVPMHMMNQYQGLPSHQPPGSYGGGMGPQAWERPPNPPSFQPGLPIPYGYGYNQTSQPYPRNEGFPSPGYERGSRGRGGGGGRGRGRGRGRDYRSPPPHDEYQQDRGGNSYRGRNHNDNGFTERRKFRGGRNWERRGKHF